MTRIQEMLELWSVKGTDEFIREGYYKDFSDIIPFDIYIKMEEGVAGEQMDLVFEKLGGIWS